jgi:hypothetical protein
MILIPKYKNLVELVGSLSIVLTDANGHLKQDLYVPNTVVDDGREYIASRMVGSLSPLMSHMGLGTDATVSATPRGDEALKAELSGNNYSRQGVTATQTDNSIQYVATFAGANPNAPVEGVLLREAGIFNQQAIGGKMLCRTTFPVVTKVFGDSLTITWTITIN